MAQLNAEEKPAENEKIVYIGGGRFGLISFLHGKESLGFEIKKIIPWEDQEKRAQWRIDIAGEYSRT